MLFVWCRLSSVVYVVLFIIAVFVGLLVLCCLSLLLVYASLSCVLYLLLFVLCCFTMCCLSGAVCLVLFVLDCLSGAVCPVLFVLCRLSCTVYLVLLIFCFLGLCCIDFIGAFPFDLVLNVCYVEYLSVKLFCVLYSFALYFISFPFLINHIQCQWIFDRYIHLYFVVLVLHIFSHTLLQRLV